MLPTVVWWPNLADLMDAVDLPFLSPTVIAMGRSLAFLDDAAVADILARLNESGTRLDDVDRSLYVGGGDPKGSAERLASHIWTFVAARKLRNRWRDAEEPFEQLADLIRVCGEADEYLELVYFRPQRALRRRYGKLTIEEALEARLEMDAAQFSPSSLN